MVAVAVSCSRNSIWNNNEVTLRRAWLVVGWVYSTSARLVVGWVTVFKWVNHLNISSRHPGQTQPPNLSRMGDEYQPKCGDDLQLGSNGRYGLFHL